MAFTFFFRDAPILEAAADLMVHETQGRSKVRVWDAGCAMGPEPYTLLIMIAERMGKFAYKNLFLDATDIDESGDFGTIIQKGEYPFDQVQRIPPDLLAKYFTAIPEREGYYRIDEKLRQSIRFRWHDLLSLKPIGDGYAMIVCKNVLLHFPQEMRIEVLRMYHSCLADGGILVTEHTQKMPPECAGMFGEAVSGVPVFRKMT